MTGLVYLIGAGPGDSKLITVKGKECIERADVIVYDYLADAHLLEWARPDAELIYAGKQCREHTMHQWEINELLVKKGKEGKIVARLKGGDPLVFGRGGEEAMALREAGVPFEFVPGVTSPIAAPAYAGIPVTQRAMATSFAVVTGHEDPTKAVSGIHWEGLATAVDTLCFVMGVGNLPTIAEKLMAHGRPANTPVALIRWGTKPVQEVLVSTLEHVVEDVEKAQLKAPAIIVVGDVVNLREQLQWFDNKPLFGKTIVVTRARSQASKFRDMLMNQGANVIQAAAIKTEPVELFDEDKRLLHGVDRYSCVVFTSAEGVRYFFDALYG
ncbi:MAG: uroporphyrinogen-III C-methyltransferase, partial [Veillonella sp.]